tara:strand:+ start:30536 stop:31801 length:1266 start_codon:yes stop_codon:yes gene_type:complete
MKFYNSTVSKKIIESLIIIFPIALLFSNILAEAIIILLIFSYLKETNFKNFISDLKHPIIIFILIFWLYLILNAVINFDNKPSLERTIFFIRFPLLILSLNYFVNFLDLNLKKIFRFWLIIFFLIGFDLFIQYFTNTNILGFEAIEQGSIYRLGGFMNDELKISNLLYHFGALIFSFYFSKNKSNLISFLFIVFITISIFLTAERANFITMISFIFLLIIYLVFKNKKTFFLYFVIFSLFLSIGFLTNNSLSKRMINDLANKIELLKFDKDENFLKKDSHYFAHYSVAYQIFERNPLFGIGLKNFRNFCDDDSLNEKVHEKWQKRKCSTHPHNFYFEMLSEIGSVGFLIIISFFIFSFYTFFDSYKKNKDTFLLLNCFIILIYFIPFLPKGSFFSNWNAMIFWFVFSFIFSIYNKSLNEKS